MVTFQAFLDYLIAGYGFWGLGLMAISFVLFCTQLYYYLGYYATIPRFRNSDSRPQKDENEGISVIVLLEDNNWYLENTLPKLLAQDYPGFEIVIVEIGTSEDFSNELALLKDRFANITTTRINSDPRFPIGNKMAFNVGIKAASYENILLTTPDAYPASGKWLSCMGKGFANGDVVIGYCGVNPGKGFANKLMRCDRLMMSVRYLSSGIKGKPYRGIIHNMGFTRSLYFSHKGFSHLNMNLGEDDLFLQTIANSRNTSIVMNPHATVREEQWGNLGWWWRRRKFYRSTMRYYPSWAKRRESCELVSRLLFYAAIVAVAVVMPLEIKIGAGILWFIRLILVRYKMWRIRRRLGETGLGWICTFYDLAEPFVQVWLMIVGRVRPASGVWR